MPSSTITKIVEPVKREMYPFKQSCPIVDYGDSDIESEWNDSRVPTNSSSRDASDNNDIYIGFTREAITENEGVTAVNASGGKVTDWYQKACVGGVAVTSTTVTGPDTRSLVKCVPVTEPRSIGQNEYDCVVGSAVGDGIQSTGVRLIETDDAASFDAG